MLLTEDFSLVSRRCAVEPFRRRRDDYMSVGHTMKFGEEGEVEEAPILWMYDGVLHKQAINLDPVKENHAKIWGMETLVSHYYGRYEPWTGKLTVATPERMKFREMPDVLLQKLHRSFPGITEIAEHY